jgi:hypothetical protein
MNIDKSLYMSEFLTMRDNLGTVELYPLKNVLYEGLYEDMRPAKVIKEVKEVVQQIEKKTIHMLKKADQNVLFPDLPELDDKQDILEGDKKDVKIIQLEEDVTPKPTKNTKKIIIDPKYVAKDS